MNTERDNLHSQLADARHKLSAANEASYAQEMTVTRAMDRFETLISDYTQLAHSIGTIQPLSEGPGTPGPGGVDFGIDLDLGIDDPDTVAAKGRRLRQEIRPALQAYEEGFRRETADTENANIQLEDEQDRLMQKVERQKGEVENLEMKLGVVNGQADEARKVSDRPGSLAFGPLGSCSCQTQKVEYVVALSSASDTHARRRRQRKRGLRADRS